MCQRDLNIGNLLPDWCFSRSCIHSLWDEFSVGNLFCQTIGTRLSVGFFAAIPIHPACYSSALSWINNHFALASPGAISYFVNPVLPSSRGYQKPA